MDIKELFNIQARPLNTEAFCKTKNIWDGISKPIDGLGDFETVICRLAQIQGTTAPCIDKRCVLVLCGDHGIVEEGVSQSGQDITKAVAEALGKGISSVCTLAKYSKTDVIPVDMGINCKEKISGVRDEKIACGTANFLNGPAMTKEETLSAIDAGIKLVGELSQKGYEIIATGEMGIGNTTSAAALLSLVLNTDSEMIVGRGAGLDDSGLTRKKEIVKKALAQYEISNSIKSSSSHDDRFTDENYLSGTEAVKERALNILSTFGGFEIGGLVGVFIGGAIYGVPIVIDGVISASAAVISDQIVPGARDYMIPSHAGREKGTGLALERLGLTPFINGNMALGEGTGAVMLFPILDMVIDFYRNAAKFCDYNIEEYQRYQ